MNLGDRCNPVFPIRRVLAGPQLRTVCPQACGTKYDCNPLTIQVLSREASRCPEGAVDNCHSLGCPPLFSTVLCLRPRSGVGELARRGPQPLTSGLIEPFPRGLVDRRAGGDLAACSYPAGSLAMAETIASLSRCPALPCIPAASPRPILSRCRCRRRLGQTLARPGSIPGNEGG